MTKNEARAIWQKHADWASGKSGDTSFFGSVKEAREVLCEPPSIAQSIRDAAVNWPQFMGTHLGAIGSSLEISICVAAHDGFGFVHDLLGWSGAKKQTEARTFMLFVAEALE